MSTQVTQFKTALKVIPSQFAEIPFPGAIVIENASATTTPGDPGILVDNNVNFNNLGVVVGDIVYFYALMLAGTVSQIVDAHTLAIDIDADTTISAGTKYYIYTSQNNNGCCIQVGALGEGTTGSITVVTIGGNDITFGGLAQGTILPVQVKKLISSDFETSIALW
jgi:hypothetical protein